MKLAKKWPEIVVKWPTPSFVLFISKQSLGVAILHWLDAWEDEKKLTVKNLIFGNF